MPVCTCLSVCLSHCLSLLHRLDSVDSKVRELRDTASKRENPWESFNATAISTISETSSSVSAVSSSSPHSSPHLRHRPLLSDGAPSPRDLSPSARKTNDTTGKERSGSGNSSDGSTRLQVEGSHEKQHRRNLSDSMTLARSGGSVEDNSSEGIDSSDGGRPSKLAKHVRHHSLTEPVRMREENSREDDGELLQPVKEGEQSWAQQQRVITEEVTDFVNKLRGKEDGSVDTE